MQKTWWCIKGIGCRHCRPLPLSGVLFCREVFLQIQLLWFETVVVWVLLKFWAFQWSIKMVQPRGALIPWDPQAANCHLDVDICWVGWWLVVENIQDNSHHKKWKTTRKYVFFFASNCSATTFVVRVVCQTLLRSVGGSTIFRRWVRLK